MKLFTDEFHRSIWIMRGQQTGCHSRIHLPFTQPQELTCFETQEFWTQQDETVKNSHRQTDRHFSTVRLCLGGILLPSLFLIVKPQFVPVHWPPCLRVLEVPWAQCFWLSAPTPDNRALFLTPRWIVIHSKSTIRCLSSSSLLFTLLCSTSQHKELSENSFLLLSLLSF